jgi:hypothetical protein
VGAGIAVVIYGAIYALVSVSDAFSTIEQGVQSSMEVTGKIGRVRTIWLHPLNFRIKYSGPTGTAHLEIYANGTEGAGWVVGNLEYDGARWVITDARLDGVPIDLRNRAPTDQVR